MPETRPIEDLRNYDEISELCHRTGEPVLFTKEGNIDLVVISIEVYERLFGLVDLNGEQV